MSKSVTIVIKAKDLTSKGFKTAGKTITRFTKGVKSSLAIVTKGTLATAAASTGTTIAMAKLADRGGKLSSVSKGFKKYFGKSEDALKSLRKASLGTISDFDLMLSANKAAMLGVTTDSKKLARLLEIAGGRAQELGISTTQAFEDIVTGIGRNSPLILDNLGITTQKYKEQIEVLEDSGRELSETEKKQILLSSVMEDGAKITESASIQVARMGTELKNLKDNAITRITPKLIEMLNWIRQNAITISTRLQPVFVRLKEFIQGELIPRFVTLKNSVVRLWNSLEPLRSRIGDLVSNVLPVFKKLLLGIVDAFSWFINNVAGVVEFFNNNQSAVELLEGALGGVVGYLLVMKGISAFTALLGAFTALTTTITAAGGIGAALAGVAGSLLTIAAPVTIAIALGAGFWVVYNNLEKMKSLLDRINENVNKELEKESKRIGVPAEDIYRGIMGFASGTDYAPGGLALVGEQGPELVNLPRGSQVLTAEETKQMGKIEIQNVNINNDMDFEQFKREFGLILGLT